MKWRKFLRWTLATLGVAALFIGLWAWLTRPAPWSPSRWERELAFPGGEGSLKLRVVEDYAARGDFTPLPDPSTRKLAAPTPAALMAAPLAARPSAPGALPAVASDEVEPMLMLTVFAFDAEPAAIRLAASHWPKANAPIADLSREEFGDFKSAVQARLPATILSGPKVMVESGNRSFVEIGGATPFKFEAREIGSGAKLKLEPVAGNLRAGMRFEFDALLTGPGRWRAKVGWETSEILKEVETATRTFVGPDGAPQTVTLERPRRRTLTASGAWSLRPGNCLVLGADGSIVANRERPPPELLRHALGLLGKREWLDGTWGREPRAFVVAILAEEPSLSPPKR
jgi:hypothetical protein